MKSTTLSILSDSTYSPDNFTLVYDNANWQQPQSTAIFNFLQPFYWDGSSNIIIDFTFSSLTNASSSFTISDSIGSNIGVLQNFNGHLDFQDDEIVDLPASVFANIDSAITVSFWCYGDENLMPFNSYIFEGRDVNGFRVINCHLPWSNSRVYWDAGNNGTGSYDRVHELADVNDYSENGITGHLQKM